MTAAIASDPFAFLKSAPAAPAPVAEPTPAPKTPTPAPVAEPVTVPVVASATAATPAPATRTRTAAKQPLYIDIETIPDDSRLHLFTDLPAIPEPAVYATENEGPTPSELIKESIEEVKAAIAKAQSNGKKLPRVILEAAVAVEQKRPKPRKGVIDLFGEMISSADNEAATIQAAIDARRKTMSLTPEMCQVVSLGWAVGSDVPECLVVGQPKADGAGVLTEQDLLRKFWELAARTGPVVGFNLLGFDLPVIFIRSILLGVDATKKLDMKPWGADVVDLMLARFPKSQAKPLKSLATWMGIEIPAEGVDGSQVAELFATNPEKLAEYNRSDIAITRALHRKYKGTFC